MRINPFVAVHPPANRAAAVACVPYDVINASEARELANGIPCSFLHVIRSEIDLPENIDQHDDRVYAQARDNLQRFIKQGILTRDPPTQPRMFLYRQVMHHRAQVGLVCCCHVDDYVSDVIRKHEKTRKDKEDDRTRHVLELNAHAEPVFLAYRDVPAVTDLMEADMNDRPLFHFVAKDGVTHTVWPAHNAQSYVDAFAKQVPVAYIADGHHRSASAARAGIERRSANPRHTGNEEYNWFLTVLFPASQLTIMPYNRMVKDLNGNTPAQFVDALKRVGTLAATSNPSPQKPGHVCVYIDRRWYVLEFDVKSIKRKDPIASLDVSLLEDRVLRPILGIQDVRTDKRIDFVGGIRGTAELERRVTSGEMAAGFSMHPTTMDQLMAVSDAGVIMPPKSTWFEPKLRSGLLVHMMD